MDFTLFTFTNLELKKILKKKSIYILFAVLVIFQLSMALVKYSANNEVFSHTGFQVSVFSLKAALQFIVLIILVISLISISNEVAFGTFKLLLTNSITRRNLILGKFFSIFFLSLIVFLISSLVGLILGNYLGGLTDLKEGNYMVYSSSLLLKYYLSASFLTMISLSPIIAFGILVSVLVRNPGTSVGMGMITYFAAQFISEFHSIKSSWFSYYVFSHLSNLYKISEGLTLKLLPDAHHFIINSLGYTLIFILTSIYIFNRKDLWN